LNKNFRNPKDFLNYEPSTIDEKTGRIRSMICRNLFFRDLRLQNAVIVIDVLCRRDVLKFSLIAKSLRQSHVEKVIIHVTQGMIEGCVALPIPYVDKVI